MTTLTRSGLLLAGLFFFLRTGAQDIIVLNSKSYHPAHHMDDQWSAVAKDAGYSNAILPYSTLDNLEAFSDADIIILSSGYQGISGNGRSNLLEYIKSGGNIYVQSEYLLDLSGNAVFKYIVNEMGNAFEWEGVLDGQVGPVQLNNGLENNDKSIQELVHYWYAAYGCGDQSITPILTKDNKSFGFYYESPLPNTGRMITISDQDWIRIAGQTGQEASLVIMQQALHLLKFGNTKKYTPLILAIDPPFENCNDISIRLESFELDQNKIEWYINDVLITNGPDLDINMIQELDFVYAKYPLEISCSTIEVTSDTFVYHPIEPVLPAPTKLSGKSMICETERLQIAAVTDNSAQIIRHFWYLNGAEQTESGGIFDTDQFEGGDVISHAYSYMQGCSTALLSTQEELTISIKEPSLPNFELIVNNSVIEPCDDTIIRVNASEVDEEQIEWYINDTLVRTGPKISTDLFQEMDFVYAKYWFETDCSRYEIVSDTFVYQPQELIIPESALLTGSTSICNSEVLEISAITDSAAVVIRHFWFVNGIEQAESEATFHTDQFQHGDVISHAYAHKHGCSTSLRPTEEELTIRVLEPSLPSIELFSDRHQTCIGDEVQLNLKGTDLDQNILWYINDQLIENHNDSLVISATLSIQEVFAKVPYIDICGYQNFLETNRINILANEISIQVEEIEHTSCDQPYGLIEVSSNQEGTSFLWDNGIQGALLTGIESGTYRVSANSLHGCKSDLEVTIESHRTPLIQSLSTEPADCNTGLGYVRIQLRPTALSDTQIYWWNESDDLVATNQTEVEIPKGHYHVSVESPGHCQEALEFEMQVAEETSFVDTNYIFVEEGQTVQLIPAIDIQSNDEIRWNSKVPLSCTECPNPSISIHQDITIDYHVKAQEGCEIQGSIAAKVQYTRPYFAPNAFSPNGDGNNDYFKISPKAHVIPVNGLKVFDRWGNLVYVQKDTEDDGWDGTNSGVDLQQGIYIYVQEFEDIQGKKYIAKGSITKM